MEWDFVLFIIKVCHVDHLLYLLYRIWHQYNADISAWLDIIGITSAKAAISLNMCQTVVPFPVKP